ncbi:MULTISPECIES: tripartite tricarboxylate transporter TctB family protein [Ramlibacter]|uniref:Tripartite tricarboxylate transporter TctB family protein n=1 Tax=Ramlibacter pinisoli TaxID=2682844 RepID=A0A6N8IZH5_9BURK|nr:MULTISPECIES: tripartite tricarboxylate transporter TctB family protein [Ramlibacter]MBA2961496.1 tripartite tricarboxylate transporter TctB family protein [Ramlibacter sp. CGMCC 1.13660]MVQ31440.1 tripartite tricarboxylate transporter TctB family protein [Ramlibacter pinisoli]
MHSSETAQAESAGAPTHIVEAVVAALVIGLGLVVIFGSQSLGSGWTSDGPGAGYFPFYIGVILCVSGAVILYQSLLGKGRNTESFVDGEQFKRVMQVLVPALVYVLVMQIIGLYVASAIYIAVFMITLGKYPKGRSIALSVAIMVLFYMLFEVWFKVPLYKGAFNPLQLVGL